MMSDMRTSSSKVFRDPHQEMAASSWDCLCAALESVCMDASEVIDIEIDKHGFFAEVAGVRITGGADDIETSLIELTARLEELVEESA